MPVIELETTIKADIRICFDLSRSIDLHQISTAHSNEKAIDGKTSGLIEFGEFVTWRATHFGITQKLSSKITAMDKPFHFRDEQLKGVFKSIVHDHYFKTGKGVTIMNDSFNFQSPVGYLGKLFNVIVLTNYLTKLLVSRNNIIKQYAETPKWEMVLNARDYL